MAASQPNHVPSIQAFLQWQGNSTRMGTLGSKEEETGHYISLSALETYFDSPLKIREILNDLLPSQYLDAEYIWQYYRRGFAILLSIDEGRMIRQFVEYSTLQDKHLPFLGPPPADFPASSDDKLFTSFYKRQWKYHPMELVYRMRGPIPPDVVLPIRVKEKLGRGVSANVHKIEVDKEYNRLGHSSDPSPTSHFVLKTYHGKDAEKNFKKEKEAFEKLNQTSKPPKNIVCFHGSFVRSQTYSLILEYADRGTLRDYMQNNTPPSSGPDIMKLWRNLIALALGLHTLHESGDGTGSQFMSGWHQDVKPTNILVKSCWGATSIYDVEFVLADLGLSHFKVSDTIDKNMKDRDTYGTYAYGAPEAHRIDRAMESTKVSVPRCVDIWSLGCIYSEVATWIGHGWPRVEQYRIQRQREVERKLSDPNVGDLFHDGEKVLDAVEDSHSSVHESRRIDDFITPRMVSDVISEMLESQRVRLDALQVYSKAQKSLAAAKKELDEFRSKRSSFQHSGNVVYLPPAPTEPPTGDLLQDAAPAVSRGRSPSVDSRPNGTSGAGDTGGKKGDDFPPRISVKKVWEWRNKSRMGSGMPIQLQDHHCLNDIGDRDSVFLIDNSASMHKHKNELKNVLGAIAYLVKKYDDNGVDQVFTQSDRKVLSTKRTKVMLDQLDRVSFTGRTNMEMKLGHILQEYKSKIIPDHRASRWLSRLIHHPSINSPKKLSLYILTDGFWQPGCDVESVIKSMVTFLVQHDLQIMQVAIQFIRFGSGNPDVIRQLELLDDGLDLELDIVDTTPSNGNVWKMILGAIHTWYDKDNRPMDP